MKKKRKKVIAYIWPKHGVPIRIDEGGLNESRAKAKSQHSESRSTASPDGTKRKKGLAKRSGKLKKSKKSSKAKRKAKNKLY